MKDDPVTGLKQMMFALAWAALLRGLASMTAPG
jgi:hypothetical protein